MILDGGDRLYNEENVIYKDGVPTPLDSIISVRSCSNVLSPGQDLPAGRNFLAFGLLPPIGRLMQVASSKLSAGIEVGHLMLLAPLQAAFQILLYPTFLISLITRPLISRLISLIMGFGILIVRLVLSLWISRWIPWFFITLGPMIIV